MKKFFKRFWFNSIGFQRIIVKLIVAFIPIKSKRREARKILLAKSKELYLSQYLYAVEKDIEGDDKIKRQYNKIWICWLQGEENAPDIVKVCTKSVRKYKPDNMDIIIITENNLKQYTNIPDYIYKKWKNKQIPNTQFSDIVRLSLLTIHGGIWIDSTVLLTASIPNDILNSKYFAFHSDIHGVSSNNWFLISEPEHFFIKGIRNLIFEYWRVEDRLLDYFIYHLFVDSIVNRNQKFKNLWDNVVFYLDSNCYDFGDILLLQQYDEEKFNKVLQKTSIHKLKYKYDKTKDIKGTFLEKILSL